MNYKPNFPYLTPMWFSKPKTEIVKGVTTKSYGEKKIFHCSCRTFGGTEITVNDVVVTEDTATIETRYRPDLTADCIVYDRFGNQYEIMGTPENIEQANRILKFKIRAIAGGA
jgi:hypothetical protein